MKDTIILWLIALLMILGVVEAMKVGKRVEMNQQSIEENQKTILENQLLLKKTLKIHDEKSTN